MMPDTRAVSGELLTEVFGFVADMYGVQLDQLAALLTDRGEPAGGAAQRAREVAGRWCQLGYADTGELSFGEPWVWATRKGLDAFGLRSKLVKPGKSLLRHTHAVTDVRLAVERTPAFRAGGAVWRPERQIRGQLGIPAPDEHVPDGEVHWPAGSGLPWAGQIWAVEVELTRKTVTRAAGIMREALARTSDFGGPPAGVPGAGQRPRYARLVYTCSPVAAQVVLSARAEVGTALSGRVEVYDLPESAMRLNTPKRGWEP
jgi:hypothetical protein